LRTGHEMVDRHGPTCSYPALVRSLRLLLLPAGQHFLAGIAELVLLLVQTCDDAAAARRRTGAIFVIVRLAGAAPVGGLRKRGSGTSNGERENS
jgi:hypothetical protein